jgi:hypothetical protein
VRSIDKHGVAPRIGLEFTQQQQRIVRQWRFTGMRNTEFEDERRPPNPPLHSEKIVTDRKIFFLDLKENDRGKFIKITEDVRGRRDTIILPIDAAQEFMDAMMRTLDAAGVDE